MYWVSEGVDHEKRLRNGGLDGAFSSGTSDICFRRCNFPLFPTTGSGKCIRYSCYPLYTCPLYARLVAIPKPTYEYDSTTRPLLVAACKHACNLQSNCVDSHLASSTQRSVIEFSVADNLDVPNLLSTIQSLTHLINIYQQKSKQTFRSGHRVVM